ncbi:MAG: MFS transporter [Anaerolineae bacterium]|nr:MFS transporter [Anaerolineae bacterium]
METRKSKYKWYLLCLILITNIVILAMPSMALSVLSNEIAQELNLNVVQIGVLWGIGSLPAIFTSLFGGSLGDKFGPKKMMLVSTLLVGLLGAIRGLSPNYGFLLVSVVLVGAFMPFVFLNGIKTIGQWFPNSQLGLANGFVTMAMALGFFLGSILSASILSPWLGGWRNVFVFYGLIGAFLCIPWFFTRSAPIPKSVTGQSVSMGKSIQYVFKMKNIWLIGLVMFCMTGAIQGVMGYLPLYLRGIGWEGLRADSALSAYNLVSMVFVLPLALMSDRMGSRKKIMVIAGIMTVLGFSLLSIAKGNWVWVFVLLSGFMRDGFMAMLFTSVIETDGIGHVYAGTAMGIINGIGGIGMSVEPALGNSLAAYWAGAPFVFWAGSALIATVLVFFLQKKSKVVLEITEMELVMA